MLKRIFAVVYSILHVYFFKVCRCAYARTFFYIYMRLTESDVMFSEVSPYAHVQGELILKPGISIYVQDVVCDSHAMVIAMP